MIECYCWIDLGMWWLLATVEALRLIRNLYNKLYIFYLVTLHSGILKDRVKNEVESLVIRLLMLSSGMYSGSLQSFSMRSTSTDQASYLSS